MGQDDKSETEYRVYSSRWGVLGSVALLTVANNILWISFASVNTQAADYYDKSGADIDLMTTISFIIGIPFCMLSTYMINYMGLKKTVIFATGVTFIGGLVRFLSTMPGVKDNLDLEVQYWLGVLAQAITGIGNPIAVSLPTKVSQHWFPEKETILATGILALALPVGITLGYGGTTGFVKEAEDVPTMNWVWFLPACLSLVVTLVFMRSDEPPTPPSKSAEVDQAAMPYWQSMKRLMRNKAFVIIAMCLGGAVGFFNAFLTLLQKMMCSRGYENWFSGLCGSLLLATGVFGTAIFGILGEKTKKLEEITKIGFALAALVGIGIVEFMRKPDQEVAIAMFCSMFGVFGFGVYPLGLELSVEASYPVDEAAVTALIFLSGQLQAVVWVLLAPAMEQELSEEAKLEETCTDLGGGDPFFQGKDHTNFLLLLAAVITVIACVFIAFFHTDYHRARANREREEQEEQEQKKEEAVGGGE